MSDISLFDAIRSQRGIKQFLADTVPQEAIEQVLKAAIRAPSAANRQPWRFVVVRDRAIKEQIGTWYYNMMVERGRSRNPERSYVGIAEAPVLVIVCMDQRGGQGGKVVLTQEVSIYPAVQNMLLAARALGLGTNMTGFHTSFEQEIKTLIEIPEGFDIATIIPMGFPAEGEHFGGSKRMPITEVTYYDRWDRSPPPV